MKEDQVRQLIARSVEKAGGQRAFVRLHKGKISATRIGQVINDGQPPGEEICKLVGVERIEVTTYRRLRKG